MAIIKGRQSESYEDVPLPRILRKDDTCTDTEEGIKSGAVAKSTAFSKS